jgi:hypothetical protein
MRLFIEAMAAIVLGAIAGAVFTWLTSEMAEGELRCEGAGAVIIKVAGKDYAVNGMASRNYPMIQTIWATTSQFNIDRLVVRGLTLCDWHTAATK